jgi:transcriptional regulator with XRE-family HTH domain
MTLREARTRRKLRQEDLAELVGVDQATISNLESGKTEAPAWPVVCRIGRVLGVKPEVLFPVSELSK